MTIPVVKEFIDCYLKGVDYSSPAVLEYCIITKTVSMNTLNLNKDILKQSF